MSVEATAGVTSGGRFFMTRGGRMFAARVTIVLERASATPAVEVACTGPGWAGWGGQGSIEDVGPSDHEAWQAGARAGAGFALRLARLPGAAVRVTRILGLTSDTNPTVVAAAAARAVWDAAGFTPPSEELARLEALVLASGDREPDAPPDLDAP